MLTTKKKGLTGEEIITLLYENIPEDEGELTELENSDDEETADGENFTTVFEAQLAQQELEITEGTGVARI